MRVRPLLVDEGDGWALYEPAAAAGGWRLLLRGLRVLVG